MSIQKQSAAICHFAASAERRAPSRLERIQLPSAETVLGAPNYTRTAKADVDFGRGEVILPA